MTDEQTVGTGATGTGAPGGTGAAEPGQAETGQAGAENPSAGQAETGKSLLSRAGEGTGDPTGEIKKSEPEAGKPEAGEPEEGKLKEGEPGKDGGEKEIKPLTSSDLTIPEGKTWDEELGKSYLDIVNEAKIPKPAADKLLALYSEQQDRMIQAEQAAQTAAREKYLTEIAGWEKAAKTDKEYGGQKWDASQAVIVRGRDNLATPEAVAVLDEYNMGSHPEILRMFYRAGALLKEDGGLAAGGRAGGGQHEDPLVAMYRKSLAGNH